MTQENPLGLNGIEFVEYSSPEPERLEELFAAFGFSKLMSHADKAVDYFNQHDIHFLLNRQADTFAESFYKAHGPCICSMGWRVENAKQAHEIALSRGAKDGTAKGDYQNKNGEPVPAIMGIGDSLIYFIDTYHDKSRYQDLGFKPLAKPEIRKDKGFVAIDHLTNNVYEGTMEKWSNFYKGVFGFTEVRYFDIRGVKTGLTSYALRSPCGKFCIPINEGSDKKSQINEYLEEYKGPGVQHLAFLTQDIVKSLEGLEGTPIDTLDIDDDYYQEVFDRVPNVTEDHKTLQKHQILIDGDEDLMLL